MGENGSDGGPSEGRPIEAWTSLPGRKLEKTVYRLQKRIFRASCRGDVPVVRSLQRLLMKSEAGRCLAVRRVTQDNRGKNTAGVDGVKAVPPAQRSRLGALLGQPDAIRPRPNPKGLDTEAGRDGETAVRHSRHARSGTPGAGETGPGARMGSQV